MNDKLIDTFIDLIQDIRNNPEEQKQTTNLM